MRLLSMIIFTFFSFSAICLNPTQKETQEIAEYNKNKAIEKLEECNKIVENCINEMSTLRNYSEKKDELEMARALFTGNARKITAELRKCESK